MFSEVLLEIFRTRKRKDKVGQLLSVKFVHLFTESERKSI